MESLPVHKRLGFTLVELMMVVALIAMMAMVAAPRLLPLLTLSEHESEARHLVGYGRSAMAHAAMAHTPIVVHIDMNRQEYWASPVQEGIVNRDGSRQVRGVNISSYGQRPEDNDRNARDRDTNEWMPQDKADLAQATASINRERQGSVTGEPVEESEYTDTEDQEAVLNRQQDDMQKNFSTMTQNTLFARAKRIQHDHDLFQVEEDSFAYRMEQAAEEQSPEQAQALEDPLLQRHALIETVRIEAVYLGNEKYKRYTKRTDKNRVAITLSPLGLDTSVTLELINEEDEVFHVVWDPMTGRAWFKSPEVRG